MRILKLIVLQLKVNFGLSALRWYLKNDLKRFLGGVGLVALVIIGAWPRFFIFTCA